MRSKEAAAALLATLCVVCPAGAKDGLGHWIARGRVAGIAFTLNCKFEQAGQNLGGVCIDGSTSDPKIKGGRRHVLTALSD